MKVDGIWISILPVKLKQEAGTKEHALSKNSRAKEFFVQIFQSNQIYKLKLLRLIDYCRPAGSDIHSF